MLILPIKLASQIKSSGISIFPKKEPLIPNYCSSTNNIFSHSTHHPLLKNHNPVKDQIIHMSGRGFSGTDYEKIVTILHSDPRKKIPLIDIEKKTGKQVDRSMIKQLRKDGIAFYSKGKFTVDKGSIHINPENYNKVKDSINKWRKTETYSIEEIVREVKIDKNQARIIIKKLCEELYIREKEIKNKGAVYKKFNKDDAIFEWSTKINYLFHDCHRPGDMSWAVAKINAFLMDIFGNNFAFYINKSDRNSMFLFGDPHIDKDKMPDIKTDLFSLYLKKPYLGPDDKATTIKKLMENVLLKDIEEQLNSSDYDVKSISNANIKSDIIKLAEQYIKVEDFQDELLKKSVLIEALRTGQGLYYEPQCINMKIEEFKRDGKQYEIIVHDNVSKLKPGIKEEIGYLMKIILDRTWGEFTVNYIVNRFLPPYGGRLLVALEKGVDGEKDKIVGFMTATEHTFNGDLVMYLDIGCVLDEYQEKGIAQQMARVLFKERIFTKTYFAMVSPNPFVLRKFVKYARRVMPNPKNDDYHEDLVKIAAKVKPNYIRSGVVIEDLPPGLAKYIKNNNDKFNYNAERKFFSIIDYLSNEENGELLKFFKKHEATNEMKEYVEGAKLVYNKSIVIGDYTDDQIGIVKASAKIAERMKEIDPDFYKRCLKDLRYDELRFLDYFIVAEVDAFTNLKLIANDANKAFKKKIGRVSNSLQSPLI